MLTLTNFWKELSRLLRRDWRFFLWTSWFLILGIGIGLSLPKQNPLITTIIQSSFRKLMELRKLYDHAPLLGKIGLIWGNNVSASISSIIFGTLLFPPIFSLFANGVLVGILQKMLEVQKGIAPIWYYFSLIPHGIFEMPAFIVASALGIRFGLICWRMVYYVIRKRPLPTLFRDFFRELPYYSGLILGLLTVAAIIEVTVSPLVVKMLGTKLIGI